MIRKKRALFFAIPAFVLLAIPVLSAAASVIMSFIRYSPRTGIFGELLGLKNYCDLFSAYYFLRLLKNTYLLSILPIIVIAVFTVVFTACIVKIPKWWMKCLALSILSVPYFTPVYNFAFLLIEAVSSNGLVTRLLGLDVNLLSIPEYYPAIITVSETLRSVFIPVLLCVLVCEGDEPGPYKRVAIVIGSYLILRLVTSTYSQTELIMLTYNPYVYETGDTFFTFMYRKGLQEANYSYSSAVYTVNLVLRIILCAVSYLLLKKLKPQRLTGSKAVSDGRLYGGKPFTPYSIIPVVVFLIFSLGFIFCAACIINPGILTGVSPDYSLLMTPYYQFENEDGIQLLYLVEPLGRTVLLCLGAALVTSLSALLLSYPLTAKTKRYPLALYMTLTVGMNAIGMIMILLKFGLWGDSITFILVSGQPILAAYALYGCDRGKLGEEPVSLRGYAVLCIRPLIVIFVISFISSFCGYFDMRVFEYKTTVYDVIEEVFMTGDNDAYLSAVVSATSIIPVALGIALIWLNKKLPLTAFIAGVRK